MAFRIIFQRAQSHRQPSLTVLEQQKPFDNPQPRASTLTQRHKRLIEAEPKESSRRVGVALKEPRRRSPLSVAILVVHKFLVA
jgi:hypothetical protein